MPSLSTGRVFALSLLGLGLTCCNLAIDLEQYPYTPPTPDVSIVEDMSDMPSPEDMSDMPADMSDDMADMSPADMPTDMAPDLVDMSPEPPQLIFTEVMVDPQDSGEQGEFVEIHNLGPGDADLELVFIELRDPAEIDPMTGEIKLYGIIYVDFLAASIAPGEEAIRDQLAMRGLPEGEHFTFIRLATTDHNLTEGLAEGTFYEFDRWSSGAPDGLTNKPGSDNQRQLRLFYDGVLVDTLTWTNAGLIGADVEAPGSALALERAIAWGLDPTKYTPEDNDSADAWCYEQQVIMGTPSDHQASPSAPLAGPCIRQIE